MLANDKRFSRISQVLADKKIRSLRRKGYSIKENLAMSNRTKSYTKKVGSYGRTRSYQIVTKVTGYWKKGVR